MRTATSTVLAVLLVVAGVGLGAALDVVAPAVEPPVGEVVAARPAESGAWYCAVGDTAEGNELHVVGMVPPDGTTSSVLRVDRFSEGSSTSGGELEVFPGGVRVEEILGGTSGVGISARWWRNPAVVARNWTRRTPGQPAGTIEGACQPEPSGTWYLPGVSTVGGATARLVVANPFDTDAAVAVTLLTPEGPESPELLKNVGVPARTIKTIELNDHAPERVDLGAVVEARAGRVVVEGWQSVDPAIGGIAGVSLAELAAEPATTWTIPWFQGAGAESWAWVANVGDRPASLSLTVHTTTGGSPPAELEEIVVPSGAVRRIDLREVSTEDLPEGALTVATSNGVPIVVSGASQIRADTPDRSGIAYQLGRRAPDAAWTIPTGPTTGRSEALHLVNTGAEPAIVDIRLVAQNANLAPDQLRGLTVAPGATLSVDIAAAAPELRTHAVYVQATAGQVVAGIHAFGREGPLDLVAHGGVPSQVWASGGRAVRTRYAPGLARNLGTAYGPAIRPGEATTPGTGPTETLEPDGGAEEPSPDGSPATGTPEPTPGG